jgi:hypothetical protein
MNTEKSTKILLSRRLLVAILVSGYAKARPAPKDRAA